MLNIKMSDLVVTMIINIIQDTMYKNGYCAAI